MRLIDSNASMPVAPVLLMDVGDLPSLVAAMIQPEGGRLVLFHPQRDDVAAPSRLRAIREHERILRPVGVIYGRPGTVANPCRPVTLHMQWLAELSIAGTAALDAGCSAIIWPVQIGIDADGVGTAMEVAQMVGEICGLNSTQSEPLHIKLPLADRTDQEIATLADEIGAPSRAFWPCELDGREPCERCGECRRWMVAYGAARADWPWVGVALK